MTVKLHKIFSSCSRDNTDSEYLSKIWLLVKFFFAICANLSIVIRLNYESKKKAAFLKHCVYDDLVG